VILLRGGTVVTMDARRSVIRADVLVAEGRIEKIGRVRTCQIQASALKAAEGWILEQRALWEGRLDRMAAQPGHVSMEQQPADVAAEKQRIGPAMMRGRPWRACHNPAQIVPTFTPR